MSDPQTPNLQLWLPVVGSSPDPTWAVELNANFTAIDQECFSEENKVPTTGIQLDADLSFSGSSGQDIFALNLLSQGSTLTTPLVLYDVAGNVYWNNQNGTPVKITNGTTLATSGSQAYVTQVITSNLVIPPTAQWQVGLVNTSSPRTITLPKASLVAGVPFFIVDNTGGAGTNAITVNPFSGDTVAGVSSIVSNQPNGTMLFISDGVSNWALLASQQNIVRGPVTFQQAVTVNGNLTVGGSIALTGGATIGGALTVGGATTLNGIATFNSDTDFANTGDTSFNNVPIFFDGFIGDAGNFVFGGPVDLQQPVVIDNTGLLTVNSNAGFAGTHTNISSSFVNIQPSSGILAISDTVTNHAGNLNLEGNLTQSAGTVTVGGASTFASSVAVAGTLNANGYTNINNLLGGTPATGYGGGNFTLPGNAAFIEVICTINCVCTLPSSPNQVVFIHFYSPSGNQMTFAGGSGVIHSPSGSLNSGTVNGYAELVILRCNSLGTVWAAPVNPLV
jgi:hypothetical protein